MNDRSFRRSFSEQEFFRYLNFFLFLDQQFIKISFYNSCIVCAVEY